LNNNIEGTLARQLIDPALRDGIGDEDFRWIHAAEANVQRSTLNIQ
jgi:hypothetical protein